MSDKEATPSTDLIAGPKSVSRVMGDSVVSRLQTALWVYDFNACGIIWANDAALALWDAENMDALARRDLRREMSTSVRSRLDQHREDFTLYPDREIDELWTLYPQNHPVRVDAILRRYNFDHGDFGMLVEARPQEVREPDTIRSADALLHVQSVIALFDQAGHSLYGNPAFRRTFGPGEQVFGALFSEPADLLDFVEGLREGGEHRLTCRLHTTVGERWFDIFAVRCKDAVTGDGAFVVTMLDVSEARAYQHELADARDRAEIAVRARSHFLSTVSHELRTPLNGVLGMASVLKQSPLQSSQRQMVDIISSSGERMLALVDDILKLVELDSGTVELEKEPFDPSLVLTAARAKVEAASEQKGLRVFVASHLHHSDKFCHDPARIGQVIDQLLDNAVKFTKSGFISLRVSSSEDGTLGFEVGDTGPGIPEEALPVIFDRFYQVDGSATREAGGTGIGLSICRALVDLWDGSIKVHSEFGRGSVFSFTVPGAREEKEPSSTRAVENVAQHLRVITNSPEN
ncbi:MAG: ATP-binding protein [Pseudomonadota bacterium]